jgi:hypothetical protein
MRLKNTRDALRDFAQYVVKQSRSRLSKGKNNATGSLYKSLDYRIENTPTGIKAVFDMNEYGAYLDQGVSGVKQKYNTPFSYTTKRPPMQSLLEWVKVRRIRFRDSKGRFTRGNYKSIAFVLQRSIYEKGIKPSLFFTRPFNLGVDRYESQILKAFLEDLGDNLE